MLWHYLRPSPQSPRPAKSFTVLHRIEGSYFTDYLVKGCPAVDETFDFAEGHRWKLYRSLWPGKVVVRVFKD